jgi:protein CASC3
MHLSHFQEQPDKNKEKLDDDQDRKNPAYVPRKGAFYEHDFRDGQGDLKQKEE